MPCYQSIKHALCFQSGRCQTTLLGLATARPPFYAAASKEPTLPRQQPLHQEPLAPIMNPAASGPPIQAGVTCSQSHQPILLTRPWSLHVTAALYWILLLLEPKLKSAAPVLCFPQPQPLPFPTSSSGHPELSGPLAASQLPEAPPWLRDLASTLSNSGFSW